MVDKDNKQTIYTDVANVETQRNFLAFEEFPEGPYGSPQGEETVVENKSTPWRPGQQSYTPFENKSLHEDFSRKPRANPSHDHPNQDTERPDEDS